MAIRNVNKEFLPLLRFLVFFISRPPLDVTFPWMDPAQQELVRKAPSTRYRGSKAKLLSWLWGNISEIPFDSVLDAFGGTASVSYLLKTKTKKVTYNDNLKFNYRIGQALVANSSIKLSDRDITFLLKRHRHIQYADFIERTFGGIYFTKSENQWLDVLAQNIPHLEGAFKRSLAYFALFQACLIKRPYNLFHRRNLYMRSARVERTFGNKTTWDTPFETHFRRFVGEANQAVFSSGITCRATYNDALQINGEFDLVYLDVPYISKKGVMDDYLWLYHFLEGLVNYDAWPDKIDLSYKHKPFEKTRPNWTDEKVISKFFQALFERYRDSILVLSYRNDGIPSEEELRKLMKRFKKSVRVVHFGQYQYALSSNGHSKEILLIGE